MWEPKGNEYTIAGDTVNIANARRGALAGNSFERIYVRNG